MKLELGQFVRTEKGTIAKIIEEIKDGRRKEFVLDRIVILNKRCTEIIRRTDKVKARLNIIDLIEVGDYVNGYPIYEIIEYEDNTRAIVIGDDNKSIIWEESSQYIKSIVTKEQFEAMQYKGGSNE